MKKITWMMVPVFFFSVAMAAAADLSARDAKILKDAGISLYEGAVFTNGGLGDEVMGSRFASSAPVEDVRAFYRKMFPGWALNDQYGAWILYDGKPSKSPAAYMGKKQISVRQEKQLPGWFDLDRDMTTEITIVVPPK